MNSLTTYLFIGALLFSIGIFGLFQRRTLIGMLIAIELMLNGASINFMFHEGIAEFNCRRFFEAHEVWEDLWLQYRDDDRTLLQGLIQVAAGCYHLQTNNLDGAFSRIGKGLAKLDHYGELHAQIDLGKLKGQSERLLDRVAAKWLGTHSVVDGETYPTIAIVLKGLPG